MSKKIIFWSGAVIVVLALAVVATLYFGNRGTTAVPYFISENGGSNNRRTGDCFDYSYDPNNHDHVILDETKGVDISTCASSVTDPWVASGFFGKYSSRDNYFDQWCRRIDGQCKKCRADKGCKY